MAISLNGWLNNVAQNFTVVEIAEKKHGDAKWRKVIRPSFLAVTSLFIMVMLFLCNAAVNELYVGRRGIWSAAGYGSSYQNCSSEEIYDYRPLNPQTILQQPPVKGAESLPRGILEATSDLELRHLWIIPDQNEQHPQNLLAMAVGIKQKSTVDKIVQKFPANNFTVMLFHYDGKVDNWTDLPWSARAIHVMAFNQTKWWFAKRFLHPDIVHRYNYIFLWDEDLGVEHFHADRYLDIMEDEGFEISQPALHRNSSEVHHRLTLLNKNARAHRRIYTYAGGRQCDEKSTGPPCTGWVEMMAPVFSRAAWRCTWNMIQNELVHAWGLDYKLGYCAQGTRSEKVGIIDAEFVVHEGIPSLGGPKLQKTAQAPLDDNKPLSGDANSSIFSTELDIRSEIRKRARVELNSFGRQWRRAVAQDPDWEDPYDKPVQETVDVAAAVEEIKQEVRPTGGKRRKKSKKTTTPGSTERRLLLDKRFRK
ncbi:unnamed protein product [Calypogeia fissa]